MLYIIFVTEVRMQTGSSVRLRADGRWEARYIKGKDKNGKSVYGYVYAYGREEAEKKRTEKLLALMKDGEITEQMLKSSYATVNPTFVPQSKRKMNNTYDALDEFVAISAEKELQKRPNGFAFLCLLYMGLTLSEICALKYGDFNDSGLTVSRMMLEGRANRGLISPCTQRTIPIPFGFSEQVKPNLLGKNADNYLLTDSLNPIASTLHAVNLCKKIFITGGIGKIHPGELHATFIRRALEAAINIQTVSALTGHSCEYIVKYYGKYIRADKRRINLIYPLKTPEQTKKPQEMGLLIFGAGSHGHAVMEVAEKLGIFHEIKFLDDNITGENIIDVCTSCSNYVDRFPCCFIAIGNNEVRKHYTEFARSYGFVLIKLVSPDTTVSKNAIIGAGTIIMPQATVNAATIGEGCIIASNALVGFGCKVGNYCHINIGGLLGKEKTVPDMTYVNSGEIYK